MVEQGKTAFVTGVTGQAGSYLAELLNGQGYDVHGLVRRQSTPRRDNLTSLLTVNGITLHEGDLADYHSLEQVIGDVQPDEVYNLAAQSHVGTSFKQPQYTVDITGLGPLRVFEAVRQTCPQAKVYQASSSEMYGNTLDGWADYTGEPVGCLTEDAPMKPVSPYGAAKLMAHNLAEAYRTGYDMHISCGILFNHESERRGELFVTRKITKALARIKYGLQDTLVLGNLEAVRDWGYAPEYMGAVYRLLQLDTPMDMVVATGEGHSVQEFLDVAWQKAGIDRDRDTVVETHPEYTRPTDINRLVGSPDQAKRVLGWTPKTTFDELVEIMLAHDMNEAKKEHEGLQNGPV